MASSVRSWQWWRRLSARWARAYRRNQEGGALAFVMILGVALFFIAMLGMAVSLSGRRASAQSAVRRAAFFCAEAGLEQARATFQALTSFELTARLGGPPGNPTPAPWSMADVACPAGGPAGMTWTATMRDNVDDGPPSQPLQDTDGIIIVDVRAFLNGTAIAGVSALIDIIPGSNLLGDYKHQSRLGARQVGTRSK